MLKTFLEILKDYACFGIVCLYNFTCTHRKYVQGNKNYNKVVYIFRFTNFIDYQKIQIVLSQFDILDIEQFKFPTAIVSWSFCLVPVMSSLLGSRHVQFWSLPVKLHDFWNLINSRKVWDVKLFITYWYASIALADQFHIASILIYITINVSKS